ncbi:MAG TPA: BON domain-containing protein [Chthoniobacterales bacterium]
MKSLLPFLCAALVGIYLPSPGQLPVSAGNPARTDSGSNQRGDPGERSPGSRDDVALTRQIRQAVVRDDSLSRNAKTIQIIARHGKVRLRGAVETQPEKDNVTGKAVRIAGQGNVEAQLEVRTGQEISTKSR